jgi:hypothetical protein
MAALVSIAVKLYQTSWLAALNSHNNVAVDAVDPVKVPAKGVVQVVAGLTVKGVAVAHSSLTACAKVSSGTSDNKVSKVFFIIS